MGHVRRRNIVRSNPWGWLKRTEGAGGDSSSLVIIPPSLNSSVRSNKSRVKMYSNRCSCQCKGHTKYGHATLCRYLGPRRRVRPPSSAASNGHLRRLLPRPIHCSGSDDVHIRPSHLESDVPIWAILVAANISSRVWKGKAADREGG